MLLLSLHSSAVWHFCLSSSHLEWGMIFQATFVDRNAPSAIITTQSPYLVILHFAPGGYPRRISSRLWKNEDWKKKTALRTAAIESVWTFWVPFVATTFPTSVFKWNLSWSVLWIYFLDILDYGVFGLCPSSGILKNKRFGNCPFPSG
jgi:hypothetical protein